MKIRRWAAGSFIVLVLAGGLCYFQSSKESSNVIEAIEKSGRHASQIIHQEKIHHGKVVFFRREIGSNYSIDAGFIKKDFLGWKWVWGGGFSGYSGQYFSRVTGTPFPMIFGEIRNQGIKRVELVDKEHQKKRVAQIAADDKNTIWFMFLNKSDGPDFNILSYSDLGDLIDSKSINVLHINAF